MPELRGSPQGWGIQRTSNGEQACRAIMMLPLMSGHIGRPGTNTGCWGGSMNTLSQVLPYQIQ